MGDRVSRPKQTIKPLQPVLKPVMAEQSSSEPAPSTVIVIMGASVSLLRPLHSRQGRNEDQTSYEQPWLRSEAYNAFPVFWGEHAVVLRRITHEKHNPYHHAVIMYIACLPNLAPSTFRRLFPEGFVGVLVCIFSITLHFIYYYTAQGDLAKKKIYPTLWYIYSCKNRSTASLVYQTPFFSPSLSLLPLSLSLLPLHLSPPSLSLRYRRVAKGGLFPKNTKIVGYARSDLTIEKLKEKCAPFLKVHRTI